MDIDGDDYTDTTHDQEESNDSLLDADDIGSLVDEFIFDDEISNLN